MSFMRPLCKGLSGAAVRVRVRRAEHRPAVDLRHRLDDLEPTAQQVDPAHPERRRLIAPPAGEEADPDADRRPQHRVGVRGVYGLRGAS